MPISRFCESPRAFLSILTCLAATLLADGETYAQVDRCILADEIVPGRYEGDTTSSTPSGQTSCTSSAESPDHYFKFTALNLGVLAVETCESSFDTVLSVHRSCPASEGNQIACADDVCGMNAALSVRLGANETVLIRVSGYDGRGGPYVLDVEFSDDTTSVGPDVFATDVRRMEQLGRVDDEVAFSMVTQICNLGDAPMDWLANPDGRHPFLVFGLYRRDAERVVQIGQSWVKHGFSSSQSDGCGRECERFGQRQFLGPGCSDIYGVATNGHQTGFGPRTEVNPWTGVFEYVGSHMQLERPATHDAVEHRLRTRDEHLDPERHLLSDFFVEFYIVSHDDVDHENSIGYKQFIIDGVPREVWDVRFVDGVVTEGPAVDVWEGATRVTVPEGDLEDDGRCYLSSKVTEREDGTWHYEYSLFNLDMSRAVGALRIPAAIGIEVTNLAFHAPESHDEGYTNEPWTAMLGTGELIWSTTPFEVDPFSNPLRWGTLYNFSFDCDSAPVDSILTVEPFAPGPPGGPLGPTRFEVAVVAPSPPRVGFKRGDSNVDGNVEVSDAIHTTIFLFTGGSRSPCLEAADFDDNDAINLTDVIATLNWLMLGGVAPPAPGPVSCASDPAPDGPPFADCEYPIRSCN